MSCHACIVFILSLLLLHFGCVCIIQCWSRFFFKCLFKITFPFFSLIKQWTKMPREPTYTQKKNTDSTFKKFIISFFVLFDFVVKMRAHQISSCNSLYATDHNWILTWISQVCKQEYENCYRNVCSALRCTCTRHTYRYIYISGK